MKKLNVVAFAIIALFAFSLLATNVQMASAYTFPRSVNVALVPGPDCVNGGALYVGSSWPDGLNFNLVNLSPATIADENVVDPLANKIEQPSAESLLHTILHVDYVYIFDTRNNCTMVKGIVEWPELVDEYKESQ